MTPPSMLTEGTTLQQCQRSVAFGVWGEIPFMMTDKMYIYERTDTHRIIILNVPFPKFNMTP